MKLINIPINFQKLNYKIGYANGCKYHFSFLTYFLVSLKNLISISNLSNLYIMLINIRNKTITIRDIIKKMSPLISISILNYLFSCLKAQLFKTCISIDRFHNMVKHPKNEAKIKPPKIEINLLLAKSSLNSFTFVIKEFSRILVNSLAVLSSKPAALYSSYTFKVSICDIPNIPKLVNNLSSFILFSIRQKSSASNKKPVRGIYKWL